MKRSKFLKVTGATLVGSSLAGGALLTSKNYVRADYSDEKYKWMNWSELQKCNPKQFASPTSEDALIEIMQKAEQLRFAGTGHSFMPLVPTDNTIISLDAMSGVISTDKLTNTAKVKAGSKLAYLAREFDDIGQAFVNLPDINTQTLAGATSTATHGTGANFMAMHAYFKSMRIITPQGEVIDCSENDNRNIFYAAKVGIGSLGAITEVTLQNRPAYALHRVVTFKTLAWVLKNAENEMLSNEHAEFCYIPHSGMCLYIKHDIHEGELNPRLVSEDEDSLDLLKQVRNYTSWFPWLQKNTISFSMEEDAIIEDYSDDSWRLLSQARVSKFNESEYHMPFENGIDCFKKVCELMDTKKDAYYPIELRVTKQDDAFLSPFYKRDTISVAIHAANTEKYQYLLKDFGPIFKLHEGRPHWGKLNNFTKNDFAKSYPMWNEFLEVRERCDPKGKLLNSYTSKIFV